jgi:hypothetical protein
MNDTKEATAQGGRRWLLLIHQLPPEPAYIRVKVRRRLQRLGAQPLKNSVYVLPDTEANLEDLQWLANEIIGDGGEATICSAALLSGVTDAQLQSVFAAASAVTAEPDVLVGRPAKGSVWVTRQDVFVDRMASAWLIRRFIDPEARFRYVAARRHARRPGEIRFDMYQGEFTHVGDRCTFETLLAHFGLDEPALQAIAEIVHDIDIKDGKFGRSETSGVDAVLRGIVLQVPRDADRVERAALVFDGLYDQLGGGTRNTQSRGRRRTR